MKGILSYTVIYMLFSYCSIPERSLPRHEVNNVDKLIELASQCNKIIDTEGSLRYALEALEKAESVGYRKGMAHAFYYIGNAFFNTAEYEKSLHYITESEKYANNDPILLANIIRIRARIYSYLDLNEKAEKEFRRGLDYIHQIEKRDDREYLTALTYENLCHLYAITNQSDSSYYYLNMNMKVLSKMDESLAYPSLVNALATKGRYLASEEKYDSARIFFDQSIAIAKKYDYAYLSRTFMLKGEMYMQMGEIESAIKYYMLALDNLKKTGLDAEYPVIYDKMSKVYLATGDTVKASFYVNKSELADARLSKERIKSAKIVLEILTKEERRKEREALSITLIKVGIILLISSPIVLVKIRRKRKESPHNMEGATIHKAESLEEIYKLAKDNDPVFMVKFQENYPNFVSTLKAINEKVQTTELHLCALIYLQFTTKDIANILSRSVKTIQNRKNSLRKKLGISSETDITIWLHELFL